MRAAVVGVALLAGCSSAVEVSVPSAGRSAGCAAAASLWPDDVSGLSRRPTEPESSAVEAWGDPAVVARCGVRAVPPTDTECIEVDGVGWIPEELSDGIRFTSFGTDPAVEVLVPDVYAPEPLLLPVFAPAANALPRNSLRCR
ncbi:MAG: hypothetical protein ACRCXL_04420 [Dermatophilaceae bacterium]